MRPTFSECPDCGGTGVKCIRCDGTGLICDVCGESEAACECEDEDEEGFAAFLLWCRRKEGAARDAGPVVPVHPLAVRITGTIATDSRNRT